MADQGASRARGISVPFIAATVADRPLPEPVERFKLLGWNGPTPVRWVSPSYVGARDGLTDITVEDEWEFLPP